jgi:hypothetical protein
MPNPQDDDDPEDPFVRVRSSVLARLARMAYEEYERLSDLALETADNPDPSMVQAHYDYTDRADEGLSAILVVRLKLEDLGISIP